VNQSAGPFIVSMLLRVICMSRLRSKHPGRFGAGWIAGQRERLDLTDEIALALGQLRRLDGGDVLHGTTVQREARPVVRGGTMIFCSSNEPCLNASDSSM
jgi:hypothetical protein